MKKTEVELIIDELKTLDDEEIKEFISYLKKDDRFKSYQQVQESLDNF